MIETDDLSRALQFPLFLRAILFAIAAITGCTGDNTPPPCADVGCPASTHPVLLCYFHGACECPQEDGSKIECLPQMGSSAGSAL